MLLTSELSVRAVFLHISSPSSDSVIRLVLVGVACSCLDLTGANLSQHLTQSRERQPRLSAVLGQRELRYKCAGREKTLRDRDPWGP